MSTYFAAPHRSSESELALEIGFVSRNPVVTGLLNSIGGLLAVLDANRQIVALNDSFMRMLGVEDPAEAFGLRPGEVLNCVHAEDAPHGCGTTEYCSTCGAAVAIVASLSENRPVERLCALSRNNGERQSDLALLVRSQPIDLDDKRYILLFLRDVTREQQRAALERTFFHDISNMVGMLVGASELLLSQGESRLALNIHQASLRLRREISIQRLLLQNSAHDYQPHWERVSTQDVMDDLEALFAGHPLARDTEIRFSNRAPDVKMTTDTSLMGRVLSNMVINAVEATGSRGTVEISAEQRDSDVVFSVWNAQSIPPDIQRRVFQRNFSTKSEPGRGVGTYSMKLLGEEILGGQVGYTSNPDAGTTFTMTVPGAVAETD